MPELPDTNLPDKNAPCTYFSLKLGNKEAVGCGGKFKDVNLLLLLELERSTQTPWRLVCPGVAVERIEPYRTLVLSPGVLSKLRDWRQAAEYSNEPFTLEAHLHAPLVS